MIKPFAKIRINGWKVRRERELRVFNLPVLRYGTVCLNRTTEKYVRLFPKSLESRTLDKILRCIPEGHDHIWIVRTTGLGEAQMLNYMIDELIGKYHARNPCFVSHRAVYKEMFGLYSSNIPFYHLNLLHDDYAPCLKRRSLEYKHKVFHVHHCTMDESLNWLKLVRQHKYPGHVIETYLRFAGASGFADVRPVFSEAVRSSAFRKIGDLDADSFVFVAPEAHGAAPLEAGAWEEFTSGLRQRHLDVFVNTASGTSSLGKSAPLTIAEAAYLASRARAIVGLRCGFLEVLAAVRERGPLHALYTRYTPYRQVAPADFLERYSLKPYPFYNAASTFEYPVPEGRGGEVLNRVLEQIEAGL